MYGLHLVVKNYVRNEQIMTANAQHALKIDPVDDTPADSIEEIISSAVELYSLPNIFFRVREIVRDLDAGFKDLADVLATDPALSSRLLRMANSAYFGMPKQIDTVTAAVQTIGFQHIYDLVIATSITRAFRGISGDLMNIDAFWVASAERAIIARTMAGRLPGGGAERMFLAGLLLDIGRLVLYTQRPEKSNLSLKRAHDEGRELIAIEKEVFGFDGAELGAALAKEWNFPEQLSDIIALQYRPKDAAESRKEVAIAHVARMLGGSVPSPEAIAMTFNMISPEAIEILDLDLDHCEELMLQVGDQLNETLDLILPGVTPINK